MGIVIHSSMQDCKWSLADSSSFHSVLCLMITAQFNGRQVVYSLIYMILIGSVAAYACYSYAIKNLPMTLVSLYAYINPIVAVVLGWLILSEKLNTKIGIAIFITVAGIYLVNKGYQMKNSSEKPFQGIRSILRSIKAIAFH